MRLSVALLILTTMGLSACQRDPYIGPPKISAQGVGDPVRGARLVQMYGCGGCHLIPGIAEARGTVGPPLSNMNRRIYVAGMLRNTPANLERWIADPQAIVPGNVMPKIAMSKQDAADIAAYLYAHG